LSKHNDFNPYFLNLNNIFCDNVHHYAYMKCYSSDEILYQQGDVPLNLYILLSGKLKKIGKTSQMMDCSVGEFIGAHANFANICYPETIKIFSPSKIFIIQFNYLQERLEQHQNVLEEVVVNLIKKRSIITNIIDLDNIINIL